MAVMETSVLPAAFAHLEDERNPAVDQALVAALPHLEPHVQAAALALLVKREHVPSLTAVVTGFHNVEDVLQRLVIAHAGGLSAGIRASMAAGSFEGRAAAMEIIVRSNCGPLVYLLTEGIRSRCPRTRDMAAGGLHTMTARLLERREAIQPAESPELITALDQQTGYLAEALGKAVQLWEVHCQPRVLEAALWLEARRNA